TDRHSFLRWPERLIDIGVTLACWAWFTCGYVLFYSWRYAAVAVTHSNCEEQFQRLNCLFFRSFFRLVRATAPSHVIAIDEGVATLKGAVVISNHLSYLDPLLLISLYERHRTIVKSRFFSVPIFGWVLGKSGYLPDQGRGGRATMMIEQMESMESFFQQGGNLFVFPEGTRSRSGEVGEMQRGALKIARLFQVPVCVLKISNSHRLFPPDRFLFNSRIDNTIEVRLVDRIEPQELILRPGADSIEQRLRRAFETTRTMSSSGSR
ncbi:MAG TPA: lysophospholipid acyltransferase family protein, partial [Desulfopila sp.]|nr:lysophospholipid acyltransferase family protein [Desulfopila sp.]